MANGSVANGKAKSPTPATNPIGKRTQQAQVQYSFQDILTFGETCT